jgi:hypothetical protein
VGRQPPGIAGLAVLLALASTPSPAAAASLAPSHLTLSLTTDPFLDAVTLFLVIATGILAFKTWQLHAATVALATDTVQATKVSDRHQQETLSPICVIGDLRCGATQRGAAYVSSVSLAIANVGSGPALLVRATVTPVGSGGRYTSNSVARGTKPLSPGAKSELLDFGDFPPPSDWFEVEVTFSNQFGGKGSSGWEIDVGQRCELKKLELCKPQDRLNLPSA